MRYLIAFLLVSLSLLSFKEALASPSSPPREIILPGSGDVERIVCTLNSETNSEFRIILGAIPLGLTIDGVYHVYSCMPIPGESK